MSQRAGGAFTEALLATAPHPDIPPEHRLFEPFVGSWNIVVRWFDAERRVSRTEEGEWHFAWVLEGRAIQDVWIVPRRGPGATERYECGATLRFFDPAIEAWRSTWIGPKRCVVQPFIARRAGDEIILETITDGDVMHWIFSDVTQDAFAWRSVKNVGGAWRLLQEFDARRA
jgi:hypothetical protein